MKLTINDLGLSVKAFNCIMRNCWRHDIASYPEDVTLDLLSEWSYSDLLEMRACGKMTANEIVYKMHLHGYDIKGCDIDAIVKECEGAAAAGFVQVSKHQSIIQLENAVDSFAKKYGYILTFEILARKIKEMIKTKN